MKILKILVACEESQAVTKEFRRLGHEAYSCDLLKCSGGHPEWHLKHDVVEVLKGGIFLNQIGQWLEFEKWDLIISFPTCTFLTVTGNRWFNVDKYGDKALKRIEDRKEAINFFMLFANAKCDHVVIENPVGIMSTEWRKPNQIINPYQFGDAFEKKTCLWIKGLPNLETTNVVKPPARKQFESGKSMPEWYAELWSLPKAERSTARSKTFPGIAKAMAEQWSEYILNPPVKSTLF